MSIPQDIIARVEQDFPHDSGSVLQRLVALHRDDARVFSERILRCVVHAASGEICRVDSAIELARHDPRDLVVAAEYDAQWKQVRDLSQPFQT